MANPWDKDVAASTPANPWDKDVDVSNQSQPEQPIIHSPNAAISAQPQPNGVFGNASQWLGDVSNDVRHGTGVTLPGRALKAMGAQGTESGEPPAVSDYMASPILGPLRAAKGITEIPQGQIFQGAKDIGGGVLQSAQLPMAMAGPEVSEMSAIRKPMTVAEGALSGAAKSAFPSIDYGGHQVPIPASIAGAAAGHYAGSVFGPIGSKVGAVLGGAIPMVRGAVQGGRQALREFNTQELMDSAIPRVIPNLGEQGMARQSIYTPAAPSPEPINRVSLPEGVNPPVERQTPAAPSPVMLSPSGSFGSGPQSGFSSASVRPATADEIAFENAPRRIVDPLESKIIDTPVAKRAAVTQSRAKFDANGKRNQLK